MKLLITGANGFVGSAAARHLAHEHEVVGQVRSRASIHSLPKDELLTQPIHWLEADFHKISSIEQALSGCAAVLHTAARVHQVHETSSDPMAEYRLVNTQHTLALARAAATQGVKRFVFLSSIKVNGEWTSAAKTYGADDPPAPVDAYGISKLEAEIGLREMAVQTGMEVVIVRPPLVYGPGVRANFLTMMRWLQRGVPLPLGAIHNQRSLVGMGNLLDLLQLCLTHPAAAHQTFMVSDGHDVSTTELLTALAKALEVHPHLIPLPQRWLERSLTLLGRANMVPRLCGDLRANIDKTRHLLQWTPPVSLDQGLRETALHFLTHKH
jgi:nucleoside-diphosphate-sugar epimerase